MGDNGEVKLEGVKPEEPKPIQLVITLLPDGRVNIEGPITNRLLCYGLLETAKEILYDFKDAQKVNLALPKQHNILDFMRKR